MSDPLELHFLARLTNPEDIATAFEMGIGPEVFLDALSVAVWNWTLDYWRSSRMTAAPTRAVLEFEFGVGLTSRLPLPEHVEGTMTWQAGALITRYTRNEAQNIMIETAALLKDDPVAALHAMTARSMAATHAVGPRNTRSDMSNVVERRERYVEQLQAITPGQTLGIPELDAHTNGLLSSELAIVVAFTKTGKSWWLAQCAVEARRQGFTPIIFSLEQKVKEMETRIDAIYSGVSYDRLSKQRLDQNEMRQLNEAQDELRSRGLIHIERPARGNRTVSYMTNQARAVGADYMIIDQLSFMDGLKDYNGDRAMTQKHGDIVFDLKDEISSDAAGPLPCMLAVQYNRLAASTARRGQGARGGLHNVANSAMIEQTADIVLSLYRSDEQRLMNVMGLDIIGSRRSDLKNYLLAWDLTEKTAFRCLQENDVIAETAVAS